MGPDERGQPAYISLEDTLMHGELQILICQDYRVLVIIINDCPH